jgi:hypothetical protein
MARIGSSMGNARNQRIQQARCGDITVRYGKDKRSNVNRKTPSLFKNQSFGGKKKLGKKEIDFTNSTGSKSRHRALIRENINRNRITLGTFIKMNVLLTLVLICLWAYIIDEEPQPAAVYRQRRSVSDYINDITNKYLTTGYSNGQSGAAWTRQRRSPGDEGDDMKNPHNGAVPSEESIVQKVFSDFAHLVKTESEGYTVISEIEN